MNTIATQIRLDYAKNYAVKREVQLLTGFHPLQQALGPFELDVDSDKTDMCHLLLSIIYLNGKTISYYRLERGQVGRIYGGRDRRDKVIAVLRYFRLLGLYDEGFYLGLLAGRDCPYEADEIMDSIPQFVSEIGQDEEI